MPSMRVNDDFSARVLVHSSRLDWVPSPIVGVNRRMLDRMGGEVARATSVVSYAAHSSFSRHTHAGGEEFLVLDGIFSDEHGDYPVGTYVRNPPTSAHTPSSLGGCVIFVKLWQFDPTDRTPVVVDVAKTEAVTPAGRPGVTVAPLHTDDREVVAVEVWAPGTVVSLPLPGGGELLVLDGTLTEANDELQRHSWLRLPVGGRLDARAGTQGARVWLKTGHLRFVTPPAEA
ncbi:hypothetical protein MMPV_005797 [Pyropia vietnamensis]